MANLLPPWLALTSLIAFMGALPSQSSDEMMPLRDLLGAEQHQKYLKEDYHDRIEIIRKAMESEFKELQRLLRPAEPVGAAERLERLRNLAEFARLESDQETDPGQLRDKEVKKLEIFCRRLSGELNELKRKVPLEERPPFEETISFLDRLRARLLRQLFGSAAPAPPGEFEFGLIEAKAEGLRTSLQSLADIDRFTEEEFSEIQKAQKLEKRVEVFLKIAESRLDEIRRRMKGEEWNEKTENPFEFFTFEDLLHAYNRATQGIMTNIDEKATRRSSPEKEIKKSLEKLGAKIHDFIPRLKVIEEYSIEKQDRALYRKVRQALETSAIAQKGAQFGLGAPPVKEP